MKKKILIATIPIGVVIIAAVLVYYLVLIPAQKAAIIEDESKQYVADAAWDLGAYAYNHNCRTGECNCGENVAFYDCPAFKKTLEKYNYSAYIYSGADDKDFYVSVDSDGTVKAVCWANEYAELDDDRGIAVLDKDGTCIYAFYRHKNKEDKYYLWSKYVMKDDVISEASGNDCRFSVKVDEIQSLQVVPIQVTAFAEVARETTYDYSLNDNGITITNINGENLTDSLIIPSSIDGHTVTKIGRAAFSDNLHGNNVTSITIPSTITEIDQDAFAGCNNLTSVTFSGTSSLTTIGINAFGGCISLSSFTLPDSVSTINVNAFRNCSSLISFNLKNVSSLGEGSFAGCTSIKSFVIGESNNRYVVKNDNRIVYEVSTNKVIAYAAGNSAVSVTLDEGTDKIGESAFLGASRLQTISLPQSLKTISHDAFQYCTGLTEITIYGNCTSIGRYAFNGCSNLGSVTMFATGNILISDGAFNGLDEDCDFYVPYNRMNYYASLPNLSNYANDINAIAFKVHYVTYCSTTLPDTIVYYGVVPTIEDKNQLVLEGRAVEGWCLATDGTNGTGTYFNASVPYSAQSDTTLYAKWN